MQTLLKVSRRVARRSLCSHSSQMINNGLRETSVLSFSCTVGAVLLTLAAIWSAASSLPVSSFGSSKYNLSIVLIFLGSHLLTCIHKPIKAYAEQKPSALQLDLPCQAAVIDHTFFPLLIFCYITRS